MTPVARDHNRYQMPGQEYPRRLRGPWEKEVVSLTGQKDRSQMTHLMVRVSPISGIPCKDHGN